MEEYSTFRAGLIVWMFILVVPILSMAQKSTGKLDGVVTDKTTKLPLPGVNILLEGTKIGAATSADGYYYIINVPPGKYTVVASMIGYNITKKPEVQIVSGLTTKVNIKLEEQLWKPEPSEYILQIRDSQEKEITENKVLLVEIETFKPAMWREVVEVYRDKVIPALEGSEFPEFCAYTPIISKQYTIIWTIEAAKPSEFFEGKFNVLPELLVKKYGDEEANRILEIMINSVHESQSMILRQREDLSFIKKE